MENLKFSTKIEKINSTKKIIDKLAGFSTEGYDEYNIQGFNSYVENESIDVTSIIDSIIEEILLKRDYQDLSEFKAFQILDAWVHCQPNKAESYLQRKLNFECDSKEDFYKKRKFINLINMYFMDVLGLHYKESQNLNLAQEDVVFKTFNEQLKNKTGSVLLNLYAQALLNEYTDLNGHTNNKEGLGSNEENFDWKPRLVAPKQYAFDTNSSFWMVYAHTKKTSEKGLYISREEDYEKITRILSSINSRLMSQDDYNKLEPFFHLAVSDDVLVSPKEKNVTLQNSRRDFIEFRELNKPFFRRNIEKITGIVLNELPLFVQFQLFDFLKTLDQNNTERIKNFNKKFGINGITTFLSLDKGGFEMGQKILDIGEKLPEESTRAIFAKYTELVYASEYSIKNISQHQVDTEAIRDYLLDRGVRWLKSFDYHTITEKQLLRKLENSKQEIFIKGQVLKYLNRHLENFDIEAFSRDFSIEMKKATELSEEEKKEHRELYEILRDHYDPHTKESTVSYYAKKLEEEGQIILDIRDNKEDALIGSIRVGKMDNGNYEIASLMVDYPYEHIDLGSLIFEKAVNLFGDKTLEGRVLKGKEWLLDYYARFGFRVAEEINDGGVPAYRIIREPNPIEH